MFYQTNPSNFDLQNQFHLSETTPLCILLQKTLNNEAGFLSHFTSNLLNNHFFSTDKSFSENSPLSLPKNVTDFLRLMFLMNMFQKHIYILQTQHWCISFFDKSMKTFNTARMISQMLPFSKTALATVKHFDGETSERSHHFFVCACTNAIGKRQKALHKRKVCVLGSAEKLTGRN